MSNVIQFGQPNKRTPAANGIKTQHVGDCETTLNKALMTVQYLTLVVGDRKTAKDLLRTVADSPLTGSRIVLPNRFYEVIISTDIEATYRAILGVPDGS